MGNLSVAPLLVTIVLLPQDAHAAAALNGAAMGWPWTLPFVGILLSIATGPSLFPKIWHDHYGKIAIGWGLVTLAAVAVTHGVSTMLAAFVHVIVAEYLSFIAPLFALYTVAGGILVTGTIRGRPWTNTGMLAIGTGLASIVGTIGAAMILIRPLIRANKARTHNIHVFIFFIILVANVGGALSPLGNPPLLVGFLHGVDFFWTAQHLWMQTAIAVVLLLVLFFIFDFLFARRDPPVSKDTGEPIRVRGGINLLLIVMIVTTVLLSARSDLKVIFDIYGTKLALQNLLRDAAFVLIAMLSLWLTPDEHREANGFSWEPIKEVAKLFAGIFVAIIPVLAMLQAGKNGAFAWLLTAVTAGDGLPHEVAYFWITGVLSAFLDNAPTYLVFFELAGGNAGELMGPLAGTLAAISMGAVYMGALTYIGNAPNLMVYAIATQHGIAMPSFFGYTLRAAVVLVPLFLLLTLLPVAPVLKPF